MHPSRRPHTPTTVHLPEGFVHMWGSGSPPHSPPREKLELFAVLCIETSHYVSFVKHGPKATDWIFFDSMADRVGKQHVLFGFQAKTRKSLLTLWKFIVFLHIFVIKSDFHPAQLKNIDKYNISKIITSTI